MRRAHHLAYKDEFCTAIKIIADAADAAAMYKVASSCLRMSSVKPSMMKSERL